MTELSQEYAIDVKEKAREDFFFFTRAILGMDRLTDRFHKDICREIQDLDALRRLWLVPRDHFKSTIIATAFPIWLLIRDPEERILVVADTAGNAEKKLAKIKALIWESQGIRAFFPGIVPANLKKTTWSESEIIIPRKEAHAEASITAVGIGVAVVGAHFTRLILDDTMTREAADSPSIMARAIAWIKGAEDLLVRPYEDTIDVVGTRWTHSDGYEYREEEWGAHKEKTYDGRPFYRSFVRNFWESEGAPLFPELYADKNGENGVENALDFARRKKKEDPYLWSCNYENDPRAPEAEFRLEDLRYYEWDKQGEHMYYTAGEGQKPTIIGLSSLDLYLTIDPAWSKKRGSSAAAIVVSGVERTGKVFIVETARGHWGGQGMIREVKRLAGKYRAHLRAVGCEATGTQEAFVEDLRKEMRRSELFTAVDSLLPGSTKSKDERIRFHLQPVIGEGRLYISSEQVELQKELRHFPLGDQKDLLDCCAYGAKEYWKRNVVSREEEDRDEERFKARMATRSKRTGY